MNVTLTTSGNGELAAGNVWEAGDLLAKSMQAMANANRLSGYFFVYGRGEVAEVKAHARFSPDMRTSAGFLVETACNQGLNIRLFKNALGNVAAELVK